VSYSDAYGLCPHPPCRSEDDPLKDRPLPNGVDEKDVTWDPDIGRGRGGYRHDKDGREIIPIQENIGGWDHWQNYDPDSGRRWAEPGDWAKPGFHPLVPPSATDPWQGPGPVQRLMDHIRDVLEVIVRNLPTPQPWMMPPLPGLLPVPPLP
jgi:hypothetical protein